MTKKLLLFVILLLGGMPNIVSLSNRLTLQQEGVAFSADRNTAGTIDTNESKEGQLLPAENFTVRLRSPSLSKVEGKGRSAKDFLMPDGRFDLKAIRASGYQGPLDLKGFHAGTDPHTGEPVLSPDASTSIFSDCDDIFWTSLESGMTGGEPLTFVWALAIYDNKLIVGGGVFVRWGREHQ